MLFPEESDNIISIPLCLTAASTVLDEPTSMPIWDVKNIINIKIN